MNNVFWFSRNKDISSASRRNQFTLSFLGNETNILFHHWEGNKQGCSSSGEPNETRSLTSGRKMATRVIFRKEWIHNVTSNLLIIHKEIGWLFQFPKTLKHEQSNDVKCHYKGYRIVNDEPIFSYQLGMTEYQLSASSKQQGQLSFHYQAGDLGHSTLPVSLPDLVHFDWLVNNSTITEKRADVAADSQGKFTVSVKKK